MDTLPVTLIVKAPNQQIEDLTVQCELSWTINKLKQHLSEVYPSKPPKNEQKLIYSGKLLSDTDILKEILRQYEGQDTHTVHLVCTPKYTPKTKAAESSTAKPADAQPTTPTDNNTTPQNNTDERVPNMQWFNQHQLNPQNMEQYTMHVLMMQQAYLQYMSQYMNLVAQQGQGTPLPNFQPPQPQPEPVQNPRDDPPVAAMQQARDPDREPNRDWLDVFYMLSRMMIFISIVYFYSSPLRCLSVVLLGLCLYLYQIGFFRNVNINNNNIVQGDTGEAQAPTRLMVLWTFFTTFFASLIPEIPNVV